MVATVLLAQGSGAADNGTQLPRVRGL
jgi:hypothetical protein